MLKNRPRVVLVGALGYGRLYLEHMLGQDTGADLVGVCDIDPQIGERIPVLRERHIPVYPSLEAFYEKDGAELAILVSPVHFHTEMALTCLAHGSNVLCEKPLCLTVEEAERMREAAKAAGRFLSVGYQLNYRRDVLALKEDILSGRFGKALSATVYHGFRRGPKYYARNNWAGHITCGGREVFDSPFTNACAHHFQMLTFLLGESMGSARAITGVEAELYRANPSLENYDIAALRFRTDDGVPILYYTAHPIRTAYWGPIGRLKFEKATITYAFEKPVFHGVMADGTAFDYAHVQPGGDMEKLRCAIEAVKTGKPPVCGVEADLAHIRAVRMVQENPITPVRSELVERLTLDGEAFLCVRDLEKTLENCAAQGLLPREAGIELG